MVQIKQEKHRHSTSSRNSSRNSLRPPFWMARALCWVVVALGIAGPLAAQGAFVRVNQVGYPMNATKRAYLMSSTAETGGTFNVLNSSGTSVYFCRDWRAARFLGLVRQCLRSGL
jgi:hypothetical protein